MQTQILLPAPLRKQPKLAKFLTFHPTDHTWFQVVRPSPEKLSIVIRRTGDDYSVDTLHLNLKEAHALHELLTTILERGN
jgi:hypothetical protein